MRHAELRLKAGHGSSVKVDGVELASLTSGVFVRHDAGSLPSLSLTLSLSSIDTTIDGQVSFNGVPVSDAIGREIYESLRTRYEGTAP